MERRVSLRRGGAGCGNSGGGGSGDDDSGDGGSGDVLGIIVMLQHIARYWRARLLDGAGLVAASYDGRVELP